MTACEVSIVYASLSMLAVLLNNGDKNNQQRLRQQREKKEEGNLFNELLSEQGFSMFFFSFLF